MSQTDVHSPDAASLYVSVMRSSKSFAYQCDNEEDVNMLMLSGCVEEITGCTSDQLLNSAELTYASLCHPDDLEPMIEKVDAAIAEKTPWDVDYRLCRPDGSQTLVRERGEAIFDDDGAVLYLQGLVSDAAAEGELRAQLAQSASKSQQDNKDIMALANKIAHSVRMLTMLAVNARIEAARAGDVGRGFAVVAAEIGELAAVNANFAAQIANKMKTPD